MIDRALDWKLREMKHTCTRECLVDAEPQRHYAPWRGMVGTERFRIGEPITVTFADRLRFFIKEIREASW